MKTSGFAQVDEDQPSTSRSRSSRQLASFAALLSIPRITSASGKTAFSENVYTQDFNAAASFAGDDEDDDDDDDIEDDDEDPDDDDEGDGGAEGDEDEDEGDEDEVEYIDDDDEDEEK